MSQLIQFTKLKLYQVHQNLICKVQRWEYTLCEKTLVYKQSHFSSIREMWSTLPKEDLQVAMEPRRRCLVSQGEIPLRSHVVPSRIAIAITERKQSSVWLNDRPYWQECKTLAYRGTQYGVSTDN